MVCYYISILTPILKINGADYIRKRFQYRCQMGQTGLDATASIIFAQLLPVNSNFKNTINDLNDAGVLISSSSSHAIMDSSNNNGSNNNSSSSSSNNSTGESVHVELTDVLLSTTTRSYNNNHHQQTTSLSPSSSLPSLSKCIIAKTFISILQLPIRLNTIDGYYYLPETFHYHNDCIRLSLLRDLIDRISIVSSIMITVRQILVKYQIPPNCIDVKSELDLHYRYVCMYVYMCIYIYVCVCMYACICMCVCMCVCLCSLYVCIYVCMCVCMLFICMYVSYNSDYIDS